MTTNGYCKERPLISCGIFADELKAVLRKHGITRAITWIEAALHTDLPRLESQIIRSLSSPHIKNRQPCLFFGSGCLSGFCSRGLDVETLPASDCIEAFIGSEEKLKFESQGCFILTPGWVRSWHSMMASLGWDAAEVRINLGRYEKILVFDARINPLSDEEIINFFDLTGLFVDVARLDFDHFESMVHDLLFHKPPHDT